MKSLFLAIVSLFTFGGGPGAAPTWRALTASRPRGTADSLRVILRYDAGNLTVGAAPQGLLYEAKARFDANEQRISRSYDATAHKLRVGLDSSMSRASTRHSGSARSDEGRLDLALATGVPLDLDLDLGTTRATLDLSTLWVNGLRMSTGASETVLTFGGVNPQPMRDLLVDAGVGSVTIHDLGNARAQHATIVSTVGSVDVDFGGTWTGDVPLTLRIALGTATLRIPRDAGLAIRMTKRIANIDDNGLTERDGVWYSAGYDEAKRHIIVDGNATLAGVDISWQD